MNTVCIVIWLVLVIYIIIGWARGFFRVLISVIGAVAGVVIAVFAAPYVSGYLQENTDTDEKLATYIAEELEFSDMGEEVSKGIQVSVIESLPLPDTMKEKLNNNNNHESYDILEATGIYDYISKSVAAVMLNAFVFLALLLVCWIIFKFLGLLAKGVKSIPIIKSIDRFGGAILGAIQGVITVWIFFLILSISSTMPWSQNLIGQINDSWGLKLLYDNNILLDVVGDLTKVLFH